MQKILSILAAWMIAANLLGNDNQLMHLLSGGYDAKTLNTEQMQQVLQQASQNTTKTNHRYQLGYRQKQQLYRHSFFAEYYLVDTQKNDTILLTDQPVRDAVMAPNGKYVVYAKADNNLYIYKIDFKTEVAITGTDVALGLATNDLDIYNGISDWLYEEEFGITALFAFSPDCKQLAFVRLDEKQVPSFEWQTFLNNQELANNLYPALHSLRYPKAGEANARASVCVYDLYYKTIRTMQLPENMDGYLPRIAWTPAQENKPSELIILHMNRDQTRLDVMKGNPKSTLCHPFYSEKSDTYYVDYQLFDAWQWLPDGRVILLSEKDGYTQAYLYSAQGIEQKCLTPSQRDVTNIYGYDAKTQNLYYQAAPTPMTRQAYAVNLRKGTTTALTSGEGTHTLHFSDDLSHFIDCHESLSLPQRYTLYTTNDAIKQAGQAKGKVVLDNDSVLQAWQQSGLNNKQFFTLTTERGDILNGWQILPNSFDANRRYPVVMMQYSGPASQRVTDRWRKRFGHYLAAQGYLVVCVDGRGTAARGRAWRNATYMQLGIKEAEDQMSVARHLRTLPYVDPERIALCGWSYGGYQTLMCLSAQGQQNEQLWKCGIAIAPVTSWRLYDSAYTERYMRRPQVNANGYQLSDVINRAHELQGELLLVHGLADDNVHVQNAWLYVDALVQAGKQFEMQMYVDDNHFLRKGNNYQHVHQRILKFLQEKL